MNKDKAIKDLKERNDKLANQYRLRDIRCICLEQENKELKEYNTELMLCNSRFYAILHDLEEWLEMMEEKETIGTYSMVQDKIQKLKEKYK